MPDTPPPFYDWKYFVALNSDEGAAWVEAYQHPAVEALIADLERTLSLWRQRQNASASQLFAEVSARLQTMRHLRPSVRHVLARHVHGIQAYGFYCVDDFDRAEQELLAAAEAVRAAIEVDRYLLPLANDCMEFHLHHARLARNQQKWSEMRHQVEIIRGMVLDQVPLCRLSDDSPVTYSTLRDYYELRTPLSEEALRAANPFLDLDIRRRLLEQNIIALYTIPGVVIPYG